MNDEADARARIGAVLNEKWTLEKLLGIGGMGAVYAARHRNGARAAVKVLHAELARHAELRDRFLREGYAANRVEHPGAVKVIDDDLVASGPDEGTAYLVMEILAGESLQDRGERVPAVSELEFLGIAAQVLDVLEAAHARGVVHRDLKPENVFLAKDEVTGETRVKVLDFGLARLLDAHTTTMQGVALGTPSYMSPEQASGRHDEIDGRTDLFSLAATGFRLVAGRRIHDGENPVQLVTKMANLPAPPIQSVAPRVSAPFARVIDRALQFKREDRYADAAAMREDVRAAMAELGSDAPVDSRAFAEAKTIVAVAAQVPAPGNATIELSARDLRPVELPTVVPPSKAVAKLPVPPERVEPPPPRSMKPAPPGSKREPEAPARAEEAREPERISEDAPPDVAPPKKRRASFLPSLVIVVLCGVALKITLDAKPPPPEPVPTAPSADEATTTDAAAVDATSRASTDPAASASDAALDASGDDAGDAGTGDAEAGAADAADEDAADATADAADDEDARREPPRPATEPAGSLRATPRPPPPKPRPPPPPKPHTTPRRRGAR